MLTEGRSHELTLPTDMPDPHRIRQPLRGYPRCQMKTPRLRSQPGHVFVSGTRALASQQPHFVIERLGQAFFEGAWAVALSSRRALALSPKKVDHAGVDSQVLSNPSSHRHASDACVM
jgi:hypothetical protein